MFPYEQELRRIEEALGERFREVDFRPARDLDVDYLRGALYPELVIAFYENAEPSEWVSIGGVILNSIADIWGENENALPGVVVFPLGFLNIATSETGDTYCLHLNRLGADGEPIVVLVSRDVEIGDTEDDVSRKYVHVADSFRQFLRRFADGQLPTDFQASRAA